jgi:hypothetical protein
MEKNSYKKGKYIKETLTCVVLLYLFFLVYLLMILDTFQN